MEELPEIEIAESAAPLTVTTRVPEIDPDVAVAITEPDLKLVRRPAVLRLATVESEEVHEACEVRFAVVPSL